MITRKEPQVRKVDLDSPTGGTLRGHIRSMGYTDFDMSRPIIGVCNPWSELNPGHWHFRALSDAVKRGIWAAGGFPLEFPTMSVCEVFHDISTLIYRNLMAMSTEEMIASMPIQGVVLLSTCDKDVPAQAMALATINKPAIIVTGGTRLAGYYNGETVACSTDTLRFTWDYMAGVMGEAEMREVEMDGLYNTCGACGVMGTANSRQTERRVYGGGASPRRRHHGGDERTGAPSGHVSDNGKRQDPGGEPARRAGEESGHYSTAFGSHPAGWWIAHCAR